MVMVCQGKIQREISSLHFSIQSDIASKICYSQLTPQLHLNSCVRIAQCFQEINFFSSICYKWMIKFSGFDECPCYSNLLCTLFYELAAPRTTKMSHYCVQYVLFARRISKRPSAENIKKSQTLQKIVSKFIQSEITLKPHPKVSQLDTQILQFFPDTHEDLDLFNLINSNLMQYSIH